MPRALKWIAAGLGGLVLVAAFALAVMPSTGFESEWLRSQAERAVDELVGENVRARIGRTTLALDRRHFLAIGIRELELSDKGARAPLVSAAKLDLGVRFWPLLRGQVEVASATLADAHAAVPLKTRQLGGSGETGLVDPDSVLEAIFAGFDILGKQVGPGGFETLRLRDVTLQLPAASGDSVAIVVDRALLAHGGTGRIELSAGVSAGDYSIDVVGEGSSDGLQKQFSATVTVAESGTVHRFGGVDPTESGSLRPGEITIGIDASQDGKGAASEMVVTAAVADTDITIGLEEEFTANAGVALRLTQGSGSFWVDKLDLNIARSNFTFSGSVTPRTGETETENGPVYAFEMIGPRLNLAPLGSPEPALDALARVAGWISPNGRNIVANEINLATGQGEVLGSGAVEIVPGKSPGLSLAIAVSRLPVGHAKNIWPFFAASGARKWALSNVFGGWVENSRLLLKIGPGRMGDGIPLKPEEASGHFEVVGTRFDVAGSIPPMRDAVGTIDFSGTSVDIALHSGTVFTETGRTLNARNGSLKIADAHLQPLVGDVDIEIDGAAAAVAEIASYDPINLTDYLPIEPDDLSGTAKGRILAGIPLEEGTEVGDLEWHLQLDYEGLTLAEPYEGQRIEDAKGTIVADRERADVVAETFLNGIRGELTLSEPMGVDKSGRQRRARLFLEAGDSEKLFPGLSQVIAGPMTIEVEQLGPGREQVQVDLSRATFELPWIGWEKAGGVAASANFVMLRGDSGNARLDNVRVTGKGFRATGTLSLDDDGLASARLENAAFGPGDDISVAVDRSGNRYNVKVMGRKLDARFLIDEFDPSRSGVGASEPGDSVSANVSAEIAELIGYNGETLTGAKFAYSGTAGQPPGIRFSAATPRGALATLVDASAGGTRKLELKADDAGTVLRFLDIYDKLDGGRAALSLSGGAGPLTGRLEMLDFGLIGEARLQSMVTNPPGGQERSLNEALRRDVDVSRARFTRGSARVEMGADYMRIEDGVVSGPSVGSTFAGTVFDADGNMSISGTFLPAYGINRIFGEIPLLGQVLGNGRGGGLLGVTYKLSGPAKSPTLQVNPLSIVAPGIFRSIFEFR
ncbi:MAG: hypothetical protein JJ864_11605 [Rhizobiaceae bacterium]|nr:hypothetical protein [Rhizobiaceae bacterium]